MSTRTIVVPAAAIGLAALASSGAQAGMFFAGVNNQGDVPLVGSSVTSLEIPQGPVLRAQGFTVDGPMTLEAIEILGNSMSGDITIHITDGLPLAEGVFNVLLSETFSIGTTGTTMWHSFDLTDTLLGAPGEYFVAIESSGSGFTTRRADTSVTTNLTQRAGVLAPGGNFLSVAWTPESTDQLAVRLFGTGGGGPPIPSPGSLALLGVSAAFAGARRRRR
ncbi:MAG: PEP-CTERM sorting domain-containing protein [Planctomycetota bacterium]|nr:MAG: PEP-CTERM sorting domain-containing protein [Planctomycetota bacterium]